MNHAYMGAAGAYRRAATAVPPLTAVVMLYDKAIILLKRAALAAESRQPQDSFQRLIEATTILRGLSHALDFERGGSVAERLRATYNGVILTLMLSYGRPDMPERVRRVIAGLLELRDAWAEIARHPRDTDAVNVARAG